MHFLTILILGLTTGFPVNFKMLPEGRESVPEAAQEASPSNGSQSTTSPSDGLRARTPASVEVHGKIKPAVLKIETVVDETGEPLGHGTGFFFSKEGHIMTNHHVVQKVLEYPDDLRLRITNIDNREYENVSIEYVSIYKDIAILRHEGGAPHHVTISKRDAQTGREVYLYGHPGETFSDLSFVFDRGMINKIVHLKDHQQLFASFPTGEKGSSGSPVVNKNGELIGILYGGLTPKPGSTSILTGTESIHQAIEEYEGMEQDADAPGACDANQQRCYRAGEYFFKKGLITQAENYFSKAANLDSILAAEKLVTIDAAYFNEGYVYDMLTFFGSSTFTIAGFLSFVLTMAFMVNFLTLDRKRAGTPSLKGRATAYVVDGLFNVLLVSLLYLVVWPFFVNLGDEARPIVSTVASLSLAMIISFVFYSFFGGLPGKIMLRMRLVDSKTNKLLSFFRYCVRENVLKPVSMIVFPKRLIARNGGDCFHDGVFRTRVVSY